ncbi:hypothetical protein CH364_09780 [Leptospira harrisiae]|uniref:DUF4325 domain-containing protein n=1 Tax=Leptospira harrisiae TaxID=2023189 RepID=A0A2N0AQ32_9LEPT|nr:DUF4325 domain-containing protein [Leptospira harrisiae]PJZ86428.1 hypothetical protein CH364_09780 [Leptospira harrisiae]
MIITIPTEFNFSNNGIIDFDKILSVFNWETKENEITIDFKQCFDANYQTLSLLVPFIMKKKSEGKLIKIIYNDHPRSASNMWKKMGAQGLFNVLLNETNNFVSNKFKPMFALRSNKDFQLILNKIADFTDEFDIQYEKTLRYILSELFYNSIEHGCSYYNHGYKSFPLPATVQFSFYEKRNEISFMIADLGIGIKKHIEQTYPGFKNDIEAITHSLKPNISGTFAKRMRNPYSQINNAGMGLYLSSNIVKRLHSDMYIISGNGMVHISPNDMTTKNLKYNWPGTFIYLTIKLNRQLNESFDNLLETFRKSAQEEQKHNDSKENTNKFYVNIFNHFGSFAEDKEKAIKFREEKIIPAINEGKNVIFDFSNVTSSPHSFINALIASPIEKLGLIAYKKIKVINGTKDINGIVEYIFEEYTPDH